MIVPITEIRNIKRTADFGGGEGDKEFPLGHAAFEVRVSGKDQRLVWSSSDNLDGTDFGVFSTWISGGTQG